MKHWIHPDKGGARGLSWSIESRTHDMSEDAERFLEALAALDPEAAARILAEHREIAAEDRAGEPPEAMASADVAAVLESRGFF